PTATSVAAPPSAAARRRSLASITSSRRPRSASTAANGEITAAGSMRTTITSPTVVAPPWVGVDGERHRERVLAGHRAGPGKLDAPQVRVAKDVAQRLRR